MPVEIKEESYEKEENKNEIKEVKDDREKKEEKEALSSINHNYKLKQRSKTSGLFVCFVFNLF